MTKRQKRDLYRETTQRIIDALKTGLAPWVRPWSVSHRDSMAGRDRNGVSQRPYHGINVVLTAMASMSNGWTSREWFTYNQAKKMGGHVCKGERATDIIFFKPIHIKEEDPDTGEITYKKIPLIRSMKVFNREQCEGLPEPRTEPVPEPVERDAACDEFISDTGARISHRGDRAYYSPSNDAITLPKAESFVDMGAYYATAFHELVHWSGASHRLDRLEKGALFGTPSYAFEELVAELGSAFLCGVYAVDGKLQHPEYINNWIKVLENDTKAIFRASSLATKAVDFLSGQQDGEEEAPEADEDEDVQEAA